MDEAAARAVDFAAGRARRRHVRAQHAPHARGVRAALPALAAACSRCRATTSAPRYLKHAIGNVSAYVAMAHAIGGFAPEDVDRVVPRRMLKKRRIPDALIERNREALEAASRRSSAGVFDEARRGDHQAPRLRGLRRAAGRRADRAAALADEPHRELRARAASGCTFEDPERRLHRLRALHHELPRGHHPLRARRRARRLVTGADVSTFCKLCGECIAVCPEKLFKEVPVRGGVEKRRWPS